MKYCMTKKRVRELGFPIYKVGYDEIQHLLKYEEPFAYSQGVGGWSCDYYITTISDAVIISTGYNPIGKKIDYELCRKYDEKAREISLDYSISGIRKQMMIMSLFDEFVEEAIRKEKVS